MAKALLRGSFISLGLAGALLALAVQAAGNNFVVTGSRAANEKSCVEPTDFMRRNHMEVIKHQRDETVHGGIRSTKHSLAVCIACHGAGGVGVEGLGKPFTTSEFLLTVSDQELLDFIKTGRPISHPDNTTGVDMPPKGGNPALTDEQLTDIIAYIRTLHE